LGDGDIDYRGVERDEKGSKEQASNHNTQTPTNKISVLYLGSHAKEDADVGRNAAG
jgi:hypothetical protein